MWTACIYIELIINWIPFILSIPLEIHYMIICHYLITRVCLTLSNSLDCSPPGSSVHGITQARILKWVIISFSRGPSQLRDRTGDSCMAGGFFNHRATWEALCDDWLGINAIHRVFLAFSLQTTRLALSLIGRIRRLHLAIEYERGDVCYLQTRARLLVQDLYHSFPLPLSPSNTWVGSHSEQNEQKLLRDSQWTCSISEKHTRVAGSHWALGLLVTARYPNLSCFMELSSPFYRWES